MLLSVVCPFVLVYFKEYFIMWLSSFFLCCCSFLFLTSLCSFSHLCDCFYSVHSCLIIPLPGVLCSLCFFIPLAALPLVCSYCFDFASFWILCDLFYSLVCLYGKYKRSPHRQHKEAALK